MPNTNCSICNSSKGPVINSLLAAGRTPNWIEGEMRRTGQPTKSETVKRHRDKCLNGDPQNAAFEEALAKGGAGMAGGDFAQAIRAKAHELLKDGKLNVRAEHGLQAQALLDRRVEKQADRNLQVELARLLSGSRPEFGPPDDLIEGEWTELKETSLAPLELVNSG